MDKISKALKKLSVKEKEWVRLILSRIKRIDFKGLDIKKLKGQQGIYRVRKGDIRIIFRVKDKKMFLLTIERKSDRTYK